jgi:hypothetical protein
MDANVHCVFPGYREDSCDYHLILFTESNTDWLDGHSAACNDTCSPSEDHGGADVVVVAIGATVGGIALIGVIVFIVCRIRRDVASDSSTPPLARGLAEEDGLADERKPEPESGATSGHTHHHHEHHEHHHHEHHHHEPQTSTTESHKP